MINQPESIPLYQAINMVGMAMYGAAWIAQLTGRERWLLERYAQSEATKMLVRRSATDLGTFKDWSSKDVPPSLQPEVESAIDRRDWQLSQWREVREWLTQHGFYCTRRDVWIKGQLLEREHFERAFTAAFPTHKKPVPASSPAALLAQTDQLSRLEESNDGGYHLSNRATGAPVKLASDRARVPGPV